MAKRTAEVPTHRVDASSFVVSIGGVEYRPRQGEWVDFKVGLRKIEDVQRDADLESKVASTIEEARKNLDIYLADLAPWIVDWSFTDLSTGELLKSPPDVKTLKRLSYEEVGWLRVVRWGVRDDGPKNAIETSTAS